MGFKKKSHNRYGQVFISIWELLKQYNKAAIDMMA